MVDGLVDWYGYPVGLACELVDLPRSNFYYRSQKTNERQLVTDVKAVAGKQKGAASYDNPIVCVSC
jgi:hypothetical protein